MHDRVAGPFLLSEKTVASSSSVWGSQREELQLFVVFQNNGMPSHRYKNVRTFGDGTFAGGWILRGGPISCPPRATLVYIYFFSVEICEIISVDDIATILARILEANPSAVQGIWTCNWAELDGNLDVT